MILTNDQYRILIIFLKSEIVVYNKKTFLLTIYKQDNRYGFIRIKYFGYKDYICNNCFRYAKDNIGRLVWFGEDFYKSYESTADKNCSYFNKEEFSGMADIIICIEKKFLIFENYKDLTITYNENKKRNAINKIYYL